MEVNRAEIVDELTRQFERYEAALVPNDIGTLSALFWESPLVVRYGDQENLYGHEEIAAFRRARPAGDLARRLGRVFVTTFGADFATTSAEFRRVASGAYGRQMPVLCRRVRVVHKEPVLVPISPLMGRHRSLVAVGERTRP